MLRVNWRTGELGVMCLVTLRQSWLALAKNEVKRIIIAVFGDTIDICRAMSRAVLSQMSLTTMKIQLDVVTF